MFCMPSTCHIFVTYFLVEVRVSTDALLSAAVRNLAHTRALEFQSHLEYHFKINGRETKKNKTQKHVKKYTKTLTCYKVDNYHKQGKLETNRNSHFKHTSTQEFTF